MHFRFTLMSYSIYSTVFWLSILSLYISRYLKQISKVLKMRYRLRLILLFNYHESVSKLHEEPNKCYQYNNYLLNVFLLNFSTKCKTYMNPSLYFASDWFLRTNPFRCLWLSLIKIEVARRGVSFIKDKHCVKVWFCILYKLCCSVFRNSRFYSLFASF